MKNSSIKLGAIIVAVVAVIALVIGLAMKQNRTPAEQQPVSSTPSQQVSQTPSHTVASPVPTSPGVTQKTPVKSNMSGTSYPDYINQLSANQSRCKDLATSQYNQLYAPNLEGSSFESFYNQNTGLCYMKATGKIHPAYSKTSTSMIYFRNTTRSTAVAECSDPAGLTFGDSEWNCVDKTTGKAINFANFNAIIYADTVQS